MNDDNKDTAAATYQDALRYLETIDATLRAARLKVAALEYEYSSALKEAQDARDAYHKDEAAYLNRLGAIMGVEK